MLPARMPPRDGASLRQGGSVCQKTFVILRHTRANSNGRVYVPGYNRGGAFPRRAWPVGTPSHRDRTLRPLRMRSYCRVRHQRIAPCDMRCHFAAASFAWCDIFARRAWYLKDEIGTVGTRRCLKAHRCLASQRLFSDCKRGQGGQRIRFRRAHARDTACA